MKRIVDYVYNKQSKPLVNVQIKIKNSSDVPETIELDSVFTHFFEVSGKMRGKPRIGLDIYMSGVSSKDGILYLILGKNYFVNSPNDLWIHEFITNGVLNRRF